MSSVSSRRLDAFDQWCICRILRIPYVAHVTNDEVRHRTNQPPVTSTIRARWLRLFDHIARANPSQYHLCVLRAAINRPPAEWPHQTGRPRWTWFCTVKLTSASATSASILHGNVCKTDVIGRKSWRQTAMLLEGHATWWGWLWVVDWLGSVGV